MDRTTDFGSVGEGSNPSAVTNNQSITLLKIFFRSVFQKNESFFRCKSDNKILNYEIL